MARHPAQVDDLDLRFAAVASSGAGDAAAARAPLKFLTSQPAVEVFRSKGMLPD